MKETKEPRKGIITLSIGERATEQLRQLAESRAVNMSEYLRWLLNEETKREARRKARG